MICPYKPLTSWWEYLEMVHVPVLRLGNEFNYLYQHRHNIGPSHFQTCLTFLGCFKEENVMETVANDHLGFWIPESGSFFQTFDFQRKIYFLNTVCLLQED